MSNDHLGEIMTANTASVASDLNEANSADGAEPGRRWTAHAPRTLPSITDIVPFAGEVLAAVAGAMILWWGAEGRGVIHPSQLGITVFIAALTVLLTIRALVLEALSSETRGGLPPALTRWLTALRNLGLVALALYSTYIENYMVQWAVAFAAIAVAATGIGGLVLAIATRSGSIPERFMDASAGAIAVVFTGAIHNWDVHFISVIAAMVLIPAFFAKTITGVLTRT